MFASLFELISKDFPLSAEERLICEQLMEPVQEPRGKILEQAGKTPVYLYFVVSGFVRIYHIDDLGEERTSHLNCPPGFITAYFDFIQQKPSEQYVACVTDCRLLRISKPGLDKLMESSANMKNFSIKVFQESLAYNEKRSLELATLTATERYQNLLQHNPDVLQHVPIQYIASFLGIKPESLSRIRRQMVS